MLGFFQAIERNMLDLDAPDHTRLRGLVHLAFTPRLVERMRAPVESLSEELLLGVLAAGSMDLIAAYASTSGRARSWPAAPARTFCRVLPAIWKFVRYIRQVIAAKRAQLQDDLISALARRASGYARTSSSR